MRKLTKMFQIGVLATVFAAGYLSGSVTQWNAHAQMRELGEGALKGAVKSQGGADDSAVKLGRPSTTCRTKSMGSPRTSAF